MSYILIGKEGNVLLKARQTKYISRKKVGDKWVYDYGDKKTVGKGIKISETKIRQLIKRQGDFSSKELEQYPGQNKDLLDDITEQVKKKIKNKKNLTIEKVNKIISQIIGND